MEMTQRGARAVVSERYKGKALRENKYSSGRTHIAQPLIIRRNSAAPFFTNQLRGTLRDTAASQLF